MTDKKIYKELKSKGVLKEKSFEKFKKDMEDSSYQSKVEDVLGISLQKKKDSTFTSQEVDTESTTEAPSEATSLESSDQTEVIEGPQGTEVIEESETEEVSSPSPKGSDDSEPTPGGDEKWKQSYKDITSKLKIDGISGIGLDADEFQITKEQASEGIIPPLEKIIPGFEDLNSIQKASTKAKYALNYNKVSRQLKNAAKLDKLGTGEKTVETGTSVSTDISEDQTTEQPKQDSKEELKPVGTNLYKEGILNKIKKAKELGYTKKIEDLQKEYDNFENAEQRLIPQKEKTEGETFLNLTPGKEIEYKNLTTKDQQDILVNIASIYDDLYPVQNIAEIVSIKESDPGKITGTIPGETDEPILDPKKEAEIRNRLRKENARKFFNRNVSKYTKDQTIKGRDQLKNTVLVKYVDEEGEETVRRVPSRLAGKEDTYTNPTKRTVALKKMYSYVSKNEKNYLKSLVRDNVITQGEMDRRLEREKNPEEAFKTFVNSFEVIKPEDIPYYKDTTTKKRELKNKINTYTKDIEEVNKLLKENKINSSTAEARIKRNEDEIKKAKVELEATKLKEDPYEIKGRTFDVTIRTTNGKLVKLQDISQSYQVSEFEVSSTPASEKVKPSKEEAEAAQKEFNKAKRRVKAREIVNKVSSATGVSGSDISGNFRRQIREVVDNMPSADSVPEGLFFKDGKVTTLGVHVIASNEEPMERLLNDIFEEYGLTIEQSGGGDAITVSDTSGNEITIDLDIARTNEDLGMKMITGGGEGDLGISLVDTKKQMKKISNEAQKLENFIQEHAISTTALDPTAGRTTLDVKELQAMAETQKILVKELYELAEVDFVEQVVEIKETEDELFKIIENPNSTVQEFNTAVSDLDKTQKEFTKLQTDFQAKMTVLDELQDLTVAFETQKFKNIREFGTPYGDLDYSLWSYSWDVFFDGAKNTILGTLLSFLELVRLPFGGMPKEDREALRKDFGLLTEGLEADITDDERTTVDHNAGFWQKFGVTLLELGGNFAGAIAVGGPAAIATIMTTLPASSATAAYEKTSERMDSDPAFDNVPESHKTFVKAGIATAIFLLEKLGLKLSAGQLNKVVLNIINEYLSTTGKKGISGLLTYITDIFSNPSKLTLVLEKMAIGGVGEGTTEAAQGLSQKAIQEIFNKVEGQDLFSDAETFTGEVSGGFKETTEEIALGFTMGALLGVVAPGSDPTLTDQQIAQAALFEDPTTYKNFKTNLVVLMQKKKMTLSEVKSAIKNVDKIKNIFSKYKDTPGLKAEEKFELTRKDFQLQNIQEQKSKSSRFSKILFNKQIKQIESEIEAIINKAEQRQSTETISDKKTRLKEKVKPTSVPEKTVSVPEKTVSVPEQTVNIPEAENIVQKAIDEGRGLTLEDLSKVAETLPDLDIDISTDRDISPEELLTKIKEYAVQESQSVPSDDAVGKSQDTESSEAVEEKVRGPEETKVEDEKQVDKKKPAIAVEEKVDPSDPQDSSDPDEIYAAGITVQQLKQILGEDPSTDDVFFKGKSLKNYLNRIKQSIFTKRKFVPRIWSKLIDQSINKQEADLYRAANLLKEYNSKLKKLPKYQQDAVNKAGGLYLEGVLPQEFFDGKISREQAIEKIENEIQDIYTQIENLDTQVPKLNKKQKDSARRKLKSDISKRIDFMFFLSDLDSVLSADGSPLIPKDILQVIREMRNMMDDFSKSLVEDPNVKISDNKKKLIDENTGEYVNKSYRVYTDKNWKTNVSEKVKENAEQFFFDQYMNIYNQQKNTLQLGPEGGKFTDPITGQEIKVTGKTQEEIENDFRNRAKVKVQDILEKDGATNVLTYSDSKGILKERKDIPIELRMLMGEYGDTGSKFITTVTKQSMLLRKEQLKGQLIQTGLENGFIFTNKEDAVKNSTPEKMYTKPMVIGDKTYYTASSVKDGMDALNQSESYGVLWDAYNKLSSAIKYGKTILSPGTQSINFLSNTGFAMINGHISPSKGASSFAQTFKELMDFWADPSNEARKEHQKIYSKYIELGIVDTNVNLNDIKEFAKKGEEKFLEEQLNENTAITKAFNWAKKGGEKLYAAGDNIWKIYGFQIEKNRYSKALHGKPFDELTESQKAEVEEIAADIIKNVYPNYDKLPDFINKTRRLPVIGQMYSAFVAFQYESYRTMINTIALGKKEISDPKLRKIGKKRVAGAIAYYLAKQGTLGTFATATGFAVGGLSGTLSGVDDEESKELSKGRDRYLPFYSQGKEGAILTLENGNGKYSYIDLSSMDPHQNVEKISNAVFNSDNPIEAVANVLKEGIIEPFFSKDIAAQYMVDIINNEKPSGAEVYNPEDDFSKIATDVLDYTWKKVRPGVFSTYEKFEKSPSSGVLSMFGARPVTIDIGQAFERKIKAFKYSDTGYKIKDAINDEIKDIAKNNKVNLEDLNQDFDIESIPVTDQGVDFPVKLNPLVENIFGGLTLREYYIEQNQKYKNFINEAHLDYKAAVEVFGMSEDDLQEIMKQNINDLNVIRQIVHNTPEDIETKYKKAIENSQILGLKKSIARLKEDLKKRPGDERILEEIKSKQSTIQKIKSSGKMTRQSIKERLLETNPREYKITEEDSKEEAAEKRKALNEAVEKRYKFIGDSDQDLKTKAKQFDNILNVFKDNVEGN